MRISLLAGLLALSPGWAPSAQAAIDRAWTASAAAPETRAPGSVAGLFALPAIPARPVMLAHAILVKSSPEKESTITDAPGEVLLVFNDSVGQEFLALAVIDPSGKRVDNHDAKLDFTDHSHLRASVSPLAPGRYTVRYRVLSADGHVVTGKYFFQVQGK